MIHGITPQQAFEIASNIRDGDNPEYTVQDFRSVMPAFNENIVDDEVVQYYIDVASSVIKEARWHSLWKEGMRLYVAHFLSLMLETPTEGATKDMIRTASKPSGSMTSKSVGSVSVGYDNSQATSDLTGWAAWKLTTYGVQFATLARMIGKGGMLIR